MEMRDLIMKKSNSMNEPEHETKTREQFIELSNELRTMSRNASAYDNEREKMATYIGEFVNLSYTLLVDIEKDLKRTKEENMALKLKNNKLKAALVNEC